MAREGSIDLPAELDVRFKIDENLPAEAAEILKSAGFDAHTVGDEDVSGADDEAVASASRSEGRVLETLDLDFANIPPGEFRRLAMALALRDPTGELWIVAGNRIRFREGG